MGRPISINIPHQLGQAEAKRRIEQGFGQLQSQIAGHGLAALHKTWADDVLTFSAKVVGQSVNGRLKVLGDSVEMEIELPEFLAMIANTIKGRLQKQGRLLLEKK